LKTFKYLKLITLSFLFCSCVSRQQLIPFESNELWGFKNQNGEIIIAPEFIIANDFSEHGIAAVVDSSGWAYINQEGEILIRPFIFDNGPDYFRQGLARYVENSKFGFFDTSGKIAIKANWDFAAPFSDGLAAVCNGCQKEISGEHSFMQGGRWGFIGLDGNVLIPLKFEEARNFVQSTAEVKINGNWKRIDKNGKLMNNKDK